MSLKENDLFAEAREATVKGTPFIAMSMDGTVVLMNERAAIRHALKLAIEKNRYAQRGPLAPMPQPEAVLTEL